MPSLSATQFLLVRYLSPVIKESQLRSLFCCFGLIRQVWLLKTRSHGSSNLAFVEFIFAEDAAQAAETVDGFRTEGGLFEVKLIWKKVKNGRDSYCYWTSGKNESSVHCDRPQTKVHGNFESVDGKFNANTHLVNLHSGNGNTVNVTSTNNTRQRNNNSSNQLPHHTVLRKEISHYRKCLMSRLPKMNMLEIMDRLEQVNRLERSKIDSITGQQQKQCYKNFLNLLAVVAFPIDNEQLNSDQCLELPDFVSKLNTSPAMPAQ